MDKYDIIKSIFNGNIKKSWIFKANIDWNTVDIGFDKDGEDDYIIWNDGVWKGGKIWNIKTRQYEYSKVSPKECPWSKQNE